MKKKSGGFHVHLIVQHLRATILPVFTTMKLTILSKRILTLTSWPPCGLILAACSGQIASRQPATPRPHATETPTATIVWFPPTRHSHHLSHPATRPDGGLSSRRGRLALLRFLRPTRILEYGQFGAGQRHGDPQPAGIIHHRAGTALHRQPAQPAGGGRFLRRGHGRYQPVQRQGPVRDALSRPPAARIITVSSSTATARSAWNACAAG